MQKITLICSVSAFLICILASVARAIDPAILLLSSTSVPGLMVEDLLAGKQIQAPAQAQFFKIGLVFAKPVLIGKVKLESCSLDFKDGVDLFTHQAGSSSGVWNRFSAEGGRSSVSISLGSKGEAVRTASLVFRHDPAVCLKRIELFDPKGKSIALKAPSILPTTVSGFDRGLRFTDGRTDTSVRLPSPAEISFKFESEPEFDRLIVWNGDLTDQFSFQASRKLKKLTLVAEGGFKEDLALNDQIGFQEIKFSKPVKSRAITLKTLEPASISEIRFAKAGDFAVPIDAKDSTLREKFRVAFEKAGLGSALDQELATSDPEKDRWLFRLRSDGTFFIFGINEDVKSARRFSALGSFEVTQSETGTLKLSLNGVRRTSVVPWDGTICELACGERPDRRVVHVPEQLQIEKSSAGGLMMRNRTADKQRTLPFSDLRVKPTSLNE